MQRRRVLSATLSEPCRELLGPERAALFDQLMDPSSGDPRQLMEELRADPRFGFALVECDTVDRLQPLFSDERGSWSSETDRSGPLGDAAFGVAWEYETRHDKRGAFNGLVATFQPITVRGFTILALDASTEPLTIKVRRYVDWAGVFGQLGLTLNWRVPLPADQ